MVYFAKDPETGKTITVYETNDEIASAYLYLPKGARAGATLNALRGAKKGDQYVVGVTQTAAGKLAALDWHSLPPPGWELDAGSRILTDKNTGQTYYVAMDGAITRTITGERYYITLDGKAVPATTTAPGGGVKPLCPWCPLIIAIIWLLIAIVVAIAVFMSLSIITTPKTGQISNTVGYIKDPFGPTLEIDKATGKVLATSGMDIVGGIITAGAVIVGGYFLIVYGMPWMYEQFTGKPKEEFAGGRLEQFRMGRLMERFKGEGSHA